MPCRLASDECQGRIKAWRFWHEGDAEALEVQLCREHAQPLLELRRVADRQPLPTRPRNAMVPTRLRVVRETRHLKKKTPPRP
jgi:hypothetical protein